jgi:L-lactate dehydrogenase (cytochrome)
VLVGCAYAYGLGAAGQAGAWRAVEILPTEVQRTTRLQGCASIAELNPSLVEVPDRWRAVENHACKRLRQWLWPNTK